MDTFKLESLSSEPTKRKFANFLPDSTNRRFMTWVLVALPLVYLWFQVINNLRLEWVTNPQYSYGLIVPLLAVGLFMRRLHYNGRCSVSAATRSGWVILVCLLFAFLYLPTRLIEEATPEWRPLQWTLALETAGLTLGIVYLVGGWRWFGMAAFPVMFFLTAVPWPTPVEQAIIQSLSRTNATMVVNVLFFLDVPAIQHGNIIEVGNGMVGVNDACSGIRSFQSSIMISLFLGEFYRFNWQRRLFLLPIAAGIAIVLNVFRTSLLTWLAACKGISAIARYHDETGVTILLVCTGLLWIAAWLLNLRRKGMVGLHRSTTSAFVPEEVVYPVFRQTAWFGVSLIAWLVIVEVGVLLWYGVQEARLKMGPDWSVKFPEQYSSYRNLPLTPDEHILLRFDEGKKGQWREGDGTDWQAFYFNWFPGRVAGYLAKRHTPDICMTATGYSLISGPELDVIDVNHVKLPMRHYVFDSPAGQLQVYQCHWEAGREQGSFTADESGRFNLIRGVWAGRGNRGQKTLEIIIAGCKSSDVAKESLLKALAVMIVVKN